VAAPTPALRGFAVVAPGWEWSLVAVWAGQVGEAGVGCGWGELPGSPDGSPPQVPPLFVTLCVAMAVAVGESVGDVGGADDFDSAGFDRLNVKIR
jgi:hypothetical protein